MVCGHIHRANLREIGGTALLQHRGLGGVLFGADREPGAASCKLLRWPRCVQPARRAPPQLAGGCRVRIALATDAWDAADQRRGHHARRPPPRRCASSVTRCASSRPQGLRQHSLPELSGDPPGGLARRARGARAEGASVPTRSTSPPRARSGLAVRRYCRARGVPFTTSYHTRYPEYLRARWPIPLSAATPGCAASTARPRAPSSAARACAGAAVGQRLHALHRGAGAWTSTRFRPRDDAPAAGRAAAARSWRTWDAWRWRRTSTPSCACALPGTKLMIGDGRCVQRCAARYPRRACSSATASGRSSRACSARPTCSSSRACTDTFGLAMIEALACGVPVAAFPVPGPVDVIEPGVTGRPARGSRARRYARRAAA